MKKILVREELDKRYRQQRKDGLPLEESPSPSLSTDASDGDDEGEMGRGPLDHLPDIRETVPGVSASGGGGDATASVEERGAPGSIEDRLAPTDTDVVPLPPPPPLQMRVAVPKRLQPRSSQKRPVEVPTLAPLKALKVNPGSTTHWVAEAQATLQRGAASVRADPKELATQGGAAEVAPTQMGEGAPLPREGEARESDGAKVPSVAEATEIGAPRVSEAEATEAEVPRTAEAAAVGVGAPATTEATMAEAGAPGTTEADVIASRLSAQEVEMKAAEASVAPLEVVDAEVAGAME
ncbi:uncharacterized protein [Miscanthus floridulus]|uniref:uncharacterized protein n=1 Tax=Miscanthus floridulus TaxID=154761 RepID=UPI003458C863